MANIHLAINPVKRSAGQQATGAAAYRAGERIRDERTGKLHNFLRRKDVTHTEIFLPSQLGEAPMQWARDRASLWNAAESAEKRRDARVAREFQVALPPELSPPQRLALARGFAQEMADRYGIGVDLAVHQPREGGDPRNFHAHLLATTREVTPWGLGDKAGLDMHAVQRARQGLSDHSEEYTAVRERWAAHMNDAFREADIDVRVDHRTLAAQGIDRQPMVYVPMEFYQRQNKGLEPGQIERLREQYRARVAARRERAGQQQASAKEPVAPLEKAVDSRSVEEIRKDAVQSWLRMRAKEAESSLEKGAVSGESQQRSGEQRSGAHEPSEQRLPANRSADENPTRDADRRQHAERDRNDDHDKGDDSAASPGHDDDASM